jgi:hypothetical protein
MAHKYNTWVTADYLGMKLKGLLRRVEKNTATVVTYIGEITVPYKNVTEEPTYENEELFSKLSNRYCPFTSWDSKEA